MATIAVLTENTGVGLPKGVIRATWETLAASGTPGAPFEAPNYPDKTVTVNGTFDGVTVTLEGSNALPTASQWHTLHDQSDNNLDFAAAGASVIVENPIYIRPNFTTATAGHTTDLDVIIVCRRTK